MSVYLLVFITTLCTIAGQLVLKRAITGLKPLLEQGPVEFLWGAVFSPLVYAALLLQVLGYVTWMFVITREKLSVAFAMSGSTFYLLMAAASWFFYGERLAPMQWVGLLLISIGVVLVSTLQQGATTKQPGSAGSVGRYHRRGAGCGLRWWLPARCQRGFCLLRRGRRQVSVVSFDLRADAPVRCRCSTPRREAGFPNRIRPMGRPIGKGGHVRVRVPATHTGQLRLDPTATGRPFDICRLRAGGGAAYQPGLQNELVWAPRDGCTHIVPGPASTDPYIVMVSERAPTGIAEARNWRRAARLATALSLVLLVFTVRRLSVPGTPLSLWAERMFAVVSRRAHWLARR